MTHLTFKKQALDSNKREELITTDSRRIILHDIRAVELSFYNHEIYTGSKLIASITYDHDDLVTQPWLVVINDVKIHRANTWAKCYHYITWHYEQGTLPIQPQETKFVNQKLNHDFLVKQVPNNTITDVVTSAQNPERETIKHTLIGSSKAVMSTIQVLHQLGYAQVGDWSPLLPSPTNPAEVMSILIGNIKVQ